ncbi:MAG: hypothetical protein KGD73_13290 [Candidatus Lokiarchaeota archaeon]|nr:hypothetical protein [Candidatus Lokiarchaeota archaeon]
MSDKKKENGSSTENSWKKRIKQPTQEEKELHETEPFVDVKLNELETEPYKELNVADSQAFVDVQVDNSQLPKRICKKCGHHIKDENLYFCPKCGKRLKDPLFNFRR